MGESHGITLKGISQVILASADAREEGDEARRGQGRRNGIRKREMSLGDSVWLRWIRSRPRNYSCVNKQRSGTMYIKKMKQKGSLSRDEHRQPGFFKRGCRLLQKIPATGATRDDAQRFQDVRGNNRILFRLNDSWNIILNMASRLVDFYVPVRNFYDFIPELYFFFFFITLLKIRLCVKLRSVFIYFREIYFYQAKIQKSKVRNF